ncbi:hypothetical protein [Acinetobacter phage vB_AbaS_TCUP2199]|nr:hypothetical protein [Acinetobacter phage vB_AbaS_TCUP2199]
MKNLNVRGQTQTTAIVHALSYTIAATVVLPLKIERKVAAVCAATVFLVMLVSIV